MPLHQFPVPTATTGHLSSLRKSLIIFQPSQVCKILLLTQESHFMHVSLSSVVKADTFIMKNLMFASHSLRFPICKMGIGFRALRRGFTTLKREEDRTWQLIGPLINLFRKCPNIRKNVLLYKSETHILDQVLAVIL